MDRSVIVLGTATRAQRGREILQAQGFQAFTERTAQTSLGCGYGVYVPQKTDEAAAFLQKQGIPIMGRAAHRQGRGA